MIVHQNNISLLSIATAIALLIVAVFKQVAANCKRLCGNDADLRANGIAR